MKKNYAVIQLKIDREYWESKVREMPKDFLLRAIDFVKKDIDEETQEKIRKAIKSLGTDDWIAGYHFNWGMSMRNRLRDAGFDDKELPDGKWDDYYHQVVEIAVGVRKFPWEIASESTKKK